MTGLIDDRAVQERLSRLPVSRGLATGLGENFAAAFDATLFSMTSIAGDLALAEAYDGEIERIFLETGKRLSNPVTNDTGRVGVAPGGGRNPLAAREAAFADAVAKLGLTSKSPARIREDAFAATRARVASSQDVAARATTLGAVGEFAGAAGAAIVDPPVLASLAFGAPRAAGAIRFFLTEAKIGAASEAIVQPRIQAFRKRAGLSFGPGQALTNIATAGIGGGAFATGLRGLARGAARLPDAVRASRELLKRSGRIAADKKPIAVREAETVLERQTSLQEQNPFGARAEAAREHDTRTTAAERALREEPGAARVPDEPVNPVDPELRRNTLDADTAGLPADKPTRAVFAAVQALRERVLRDADGIERLKQIRAAARELIAFGPEDVIAAVRNPPRAPKVQGLASFLVRAGGLREDAGELAARGITARSRPGLINNRRTAPLGRRAGMSLDEASLTAMEEGFFIERGEGRPDTDEFLDALKRDFGGEPVLRQADADRLAIFDQELAGVEMLNRVLDELEIDAGRLSPDELRARLEALSELDLPAEASATAERGAPLTAADAARIDADIRAFDDALEAEVRGRIDEREGIKLEDVFELEDELGNTRRVSAKKALAELDDDKKFIDELADCVGRSAA